MAGMWYVHADDDSVGLVGTVAQALGAGSRVVREATALGLRRRLLACAPGSACAAVGPATGDVDPVNLAAALVRDGHAREVVLVVDAASGSLRSRAARAGVTRVLDRVEAQRLAPARGDGVGAAGQPARPTPAQAPEAPAFDDDAGPLDMPDLDGVSSPPQACAIPRHLHGDRAPKAVARRADAAPAIVVASGRGGVGKSAIVAAMACAAASWGLRVSVVDLDLYAGNLYGYFGLGEAPTLDALEQGGDVDEARLLSLGAAACDGVTLWGPCRRPEMAEAVAPYASDLLACAANAADIVLVDTPTTWTDAVAEAVQGCDRLLLVGDERAGSVSSMTRVAALAVRLGVARTRIARATNRQDPRQREEPFLFRADVGLETARAFPVLEGTDEVAECLSAGQVAQLAAGGGDFASSVETMLAKLLEELGRLPDTGPARAARDREVMRRPRGLFSRMREAG